jgi:hypothetical protein
VGVEVADRDPAVGAPVDPAVHRGDGLMAQDHVARGVATDDGRVGRERPAGTGVEPAGDREDRPVGAGIRLARVAAGGPARGSARACPGGRRGDRCAFVEPGPRDGGAGLHRPAVQPERTAGGAAERDRQLRHGEVGLGDDHLDVALSGAVVVDQMHRPAGSRAGLTPT